MEAAPPTPAAYSPLAWYKVDDSVRHDANPALGGQGVSAWRDSSGNGNDLMSNQLETMRPVYQQDGCIEGDGGDFLSCAALAGVKTQPLRIIALAQYTTVSANSILWSNTAQNSCYLIARGLTGNKLTANAGGSTGEIEGPVADTEKRLYEVYYNGSGSDLRLNGVSVDSSGNMGTSQLDSFNLFGRYSASSVGSGAKVKIWEVVVLQGANASEANAANVRSYFATKFGIAVAGAPGSAALLSTQTFGSGLLSGNPSQHAAASISQPVPGVRFLAIGDQDMSGVYGYARKGCVHVFKEVGGKWTYHQRISSPNTRLSQWMGHAVRSGGPWIMCGNTHALAYSGAPEGEVEMWKYDAASDRYVYHSVLQGGDTAVGDEFGMLIDADFENGWIIIGSPQLHDYNTATGGKIYFYRLVGDSWVEQQHFSEPGGPFAGSANDNAFGMEVCIRGNHAFASSFSPPPGISGMNYYRGVVYHYTLTNGVWSYRSTITPATQRPGQRFGASLGFDGVRLVSFDWGAKSFSDGGFTVFKWTGSTWVQEFTFTDTANPDIPNSNPHRWGHKGLFVNGDTIIASERFAQADWTGVPDMNGPPSAKGIVYVFKRINDLWYKSHVIAPASRQPGDWFGDLMCLDGTSKLLVVSTGATRNSQKTMLLQKFDLNSASPSALSSGSPWLTVYLDEGNSEPPTVSEIRVGDLQTDQKRRIFFASPPANTSVLEYSTDLRNWVPITPPVASGRFYVDSPTESRGFFRLALTVDN